MYKAINKTRPIQSYMEALVFHTGAPTEIWNKTQIVFMLLKLKLLLLELNTLTFLSISYNNNLTMVFFPK